MATGEMHVNQPLTNLSIEYVNESYIADRVFPTLPVLKSSDLYYIYTTDFRLPETRRAYGAPANSVTWGVSTATYQLEWHALKDSVTDKARENTDAPLSLDADTTAFLTDKIEMRKEVKAAAILFTTTSWSNTRTITTSAESWNTSASYPVQAVLSINALILGSSGKRPNVGVMGNAGYIVTRENANVISRIQYVERAIVTPDILASLFDLDTIYIGTAVTDTGQEGITASAAAIWADNFFIGYMNPTPSRKMASAAYKLSKSGGRKVKKWRDEEIEGDWIEVQEEFQYRAVASACGAIIKTINLT